LAGERSRRPPLIIRIGGLFISLQFFFLCFVYYGLRFQRTCILRQPLARISCLRNTLPMSFIPSHPLASRFDTARLGPISSKAALTPTDASLPHFASPYPTLPRTVGVCAGNRKMSNTILTVVEPYTPYNSTCGYCHGTRATNVQAASLEAYRMSCSV